MRARLLKPEFFDDENLAKLPIEAHFLFAGLWCLADREGRLKDIPRRIAADVYCQRQDIGEPLVDLWLTNLAELKLIHRYVVDGCHYIQVVNFLKHQKPHKNEAHSTIPAPDVLPKAGQCTANVLPMSRQGQAIGEPSRARSEAEAEAEAVYESGNAPVSPTRAIIDPDEWQAITEEIWNEHPPDRRGTLQESRQYARESLGDSVNQKADYRAARENHRKWMAIYRASKPLHSLKTWWTQGLWAQDPGEPHRAAAPPPPRRYNPMDEVRRLAAAKEIPK